MKRIGVIGGGTMGQGISEMLAKKGLDVVLMERSEQKLDEAIEMIGVSLDKQIEKWGITETEKKLILSHVQKARNEDDFAKCDLVIESISEDLEMKKAVFAMLDRICAPHVILASNTSTLSLTEIASVAKVPERIIGLHFLHPVAKIDLVEIIRAMKTSDGTFLATKQFVEDTIDKTGIMVYESPGFVTSRMILLLINEAMHCLSEGVASAKDIDMAMRVGYDFRYGPLEMADRFGLDSVLAAMERLFREFGDIKYRPSFLLKKMVRAGHLGVKSGEGFFRYDKDGDRL